MMIFRSTIFLVMAEVVFALSGYFIQAGLGRFLGPEEYGRYSLVIGFTTMLIILIGRGIPTAMAKRISEYADDRATIRAIKATAARWQYSIITVATLIFYFCAPLIARGFGDATLTPLFQLAAFVIPAFALSSFHVLYFNGLKRFGAMSALKAARGVFRLGWIVGLAYWFSITGAIIGAIAAPLCVFMLALIIDYAINRAENHVLTTDTNHTTNSINTYPVRKLLTYAGGFMLFLLFYEFFVRLDIYLIKRILGDDTAVGIYNAAMTAALIPYYLLYALALVLFPTISTLTTNGTHHAQKLISTVLRFLFIIIIPTGLLLALFAQPLVQLLFGAQFVASAQLVPLMIGGTIFGTIFYILAAVFNGAGMTHIPARIVASAIVVSISTNTILLPLYGITATAVIFSLTSTSMGALTLFFAHRVFGATIPAATILRIIAAIGILWTIVYILASSAVISITSLATIPAMFIGGCILMTSYFALMIILGEFTRSDIAFLRRK